MRLKLFTEDLARYPQVDASGRMLTLQAVRPGTNGAVARFAELLDRTAAEALRGTALTVPRALLPPLAEGEYYHVDVLGLPCLSAAGERLGHVVGIEDFGAGDILEIEDADGVRRMLPFRAPIAMLEAERVIVDPLFLA